MSAASSPAGDQGRDRPPAADWSPRAVRVQAGLLLGALRLLAASWRVRAEGLAAFDIALAVGRPSLLAFWDGTYVPLFVVLAGRRALVFSSLSRRGAVIAEIGRRCGYRSALLANAGGEVELERMRQALAGEVAAGIAVDGPLGPAREVKRGAVQLAIEQGRLLFAIAVAADRSWVDEQRWDHFAIPRPLAHVAVVLAPPLDLADLRATVVGLGAVADTEAAAVGTTLAAAVAVGRERLAAALLAAERRAEELLLPGAQVALRRLDPRPRSDGRPAVDHGVRSDAGSSRS